MKQYLFLFRVLYFFFFFNIYYSRVVCANEHTDLYKEYSLSDENVPPKVAITVPREPEIFLQVNDRIEIRVTVSDIDGVVRKVIFFRNGVLVHTDLTVSDGFTYNLTDTVAGLSIITAAAFDDAGAQAYSKPLKVTISNTPTNQPYKIESLKEACSIDFICPDIIANNLVENVIGYDFDMHFNPDKVTPSNLIRVATDLVQDTSWISYRMRKVNDSLLRASVYFNVNAPKNISFNGTGNLFCVEFLKSPSFDMGDTALFSIDLMSESYLTEVVDKKVNDGHYVTVKDSIFRGSVTSWLNNAPIKDPEGAEENIFLFGNKRKSSTPVNEKGLFYYDINNGDRVSLFRNLDNDYDMQPYISGYDAYLMSKVLELDTVFTPSIYQIIAMDVNRDGKITDGDLAQIQMRSTARIDEFIQASDTTKDWLFITSKELKQDTTFKISARYPYDDGVGYSKFRVPRTSDLFIIDIENNQNCPRIATEKFKTVLLGDVTGNYGHSLIDSISNPDTIAFAIKRLNHKEYEITIEVLSLDTVKGVDLFFSLNNNLLLREIISFQDNDDFIVSENKKIKFSGYYNLESTNKKIKLKVYSDSLIKLSDFEFFNLYVNEKLAQLKLYYEPSDSYFYNPLQVEIYPNPTYGIINIKFNAENATVSILSMLGVELATLRNVNQQCVFDFEYLPTASYIVKVETEKASVQQIVLRKKHKK
ncbi:MAG: T9SS type A sorting domain-containing protein [Bacteroidales bacterium]|nr:T9SS type A sorting domain-containing protein [Bacteroidales bacterium]